MTWEFAILDFLQAHCRSAWGDALMVAVSSLGNHGIFWILLALALLCCRRTRRLGWALSLGLALNVLVCNGLLKPLVARTRPYDIRTAVLLIAEKPHDYSFPSGHSAMAFASASALRTARCRWWPAALVLAAVIAFSRLYLYMHFPTDVLAGLVLGWLCGWLGAKLAERLADAWQKRRGANA